jgi:hypothetical protein
MGFLWGPTQLSFPICRTFFSRWLVYFVEYACQLWGGDSNWSSLCQKIPFGAGFGIKYSQIGVMDGFSPLVVFRDIILNWKARSNKLQVHLSWYRIYLLFCFGPIILTLNVGAIEFTHYLETFGWFKKCLLMFFIELHFLILLWLIFQVTCFEKEKKT